MSRPERRGGAPGRAAKAADDHRDVILYRARADEPVSERVYNLYNLAANAATYGLVTGSARTGLGTAPPIGPALATESLYYQALRAYSYFDWEFGRALVCDPTIWPLPESLAVIVGRFPGRFADTFSNEQPERLTKVRRALQALAPDLKQFELRRLRPGDYSVPPGSRQAAFSPAIRANLWRGTKSKLEGIARDAYRADATDVQSKLEAMLGAFAPLCTVFAAVFDSETPTRSFTRMTVYQPAYHTLRADDLDRPQSWYLDKGLRKLALPKPVQISAAELTHIRYLEHADLDKHQAIKLEVRRDFADRDLVTTVASFGRMFEGGDDELYAFDASDPRDAIQVVFRPRLPPAADDNAAVRTFKHAFNMVFAGFEVEARVHTLGLRLCRAPGGPTEAEPDEDDVLRPRFDPASSKISFRAHRYVDSAVERLPYVAAGFQCERLESGPRRFHLWQDYWTWDRFREDFLANRDLREAADSPPGRWRDRLLAEIVGTATRVVLDRSIPNIENAIDDEIARIATDYLDRYSKARDVLTDRLHDSLF